MCSSMRDVPRLRAGSRGNMLDSPLLETIFLQARVYHQLHRQRTAWDCFQQHLVSVMRGPVVPTYDDERLLKVTWITPSGSPLD